MKKKEEVYVVVESEKKAEKLQKVLDMFGQRIYSKDTINYSVKWVLGISFEGSCKKWLNDDVSTLIRLGKTKVSIKELRNILAKERLTKGDVILATIGKSEYIVEVDSTDGSQAYINGIKYYCSSNGSYQVYNGGSFHYFKRYATEEEKALLNPVEVKKELEVGEWYKTNKTLFNHQKGYNSYGFLRGDWCDKNWLTSSENWDEGDLPKEATQSEVESALIAEAKKRYKSGDKLGRLSNYEYGCGNGIIDCDFFFENGRIITHTEDDYYHCVFQNGQWAEPLPEDNTINDKDISAIERLHDTLRENHGYTLESRILTEARKVIDKLKP